MRARPIAATCLLAFAFAAAISGQITQNPIPAPIEKRGLAVEIPAGTSAGIAPPARAGVGDNAVPGLPGPARRSHYRGDFRSRRRVPQARFG